MSQRIRRAALLGGRGLVDPADGEAEQLVDRAHPLGVAAGQVVVDRDHVDRAPRGIAGGGDGGGQRLALTGGHLHDVTGEQRLRAEQLHVIGALVEGALGGLAAQRARLDEVLRVVPLVQRRGGGAELVVGELGQLGLALLDQREKSLHRLEVDRGAGLLLQLATPRVEFAHQTHGHHDTSPTGGRVRPITVT